MRSLAPLSRKYKALLGGGVVVLGVVAVFAVCGSRGWRHLQRLQQKQERLEVLASRLEQQNARLRQHLRRLESDDVYLERMVRERLGWIRAGEMIYRVHGTVVVPPAAKALNAAAGAGTRSSAPVGGD